MNAWVPRSQTIRLAGRCRFPIPELILVSVLVDCHSRMGGLAGDSSLISRASSWLGVLLLGKHRNCKTGWEDWQDWQDEHIAADGPCAMDEERRQEPFKAVRCCRYPANPPILFSCGFCNCTERQDGRIGRIGRIGRMNTSELKVCATWIRSEPARAFPKQLPLLLS